MKELILKSVYAGLGLLNSGKETVEHLSQKIAEKANLTEQDGEKIARLIRVRSQKAVKSLEKTLRTEVATVVDALHEATKADLDGMSSKRAAANKSSGKSRKARG
jgi:polyhydroxyalkanoate synthesis regulator phasin